MASRHYLVAFVVVPLFQLVAAGSAMAGAKPQPGRLSNPGFHNQRIKTTFFFAGQARDGSVRYGGIKAGPNLGLFTVHPQDDRHLNWSVNHKNRAFAVKSMEEAGVNVVTMSTWGEDFLPPNKVGWTMDAPMQVAPEATDELYAAADKKLLIMPLIESRRDWAFRDEFPTWTDKRVAPGTVSQIKELIKRHLKNPKHPEWANRWAQVYDRTGTPRYAVGIIQASSTRLGPNDHKAYAAGFDLVAAEVFKATKVHVGFFLDALPPLKNVPGSFKPNPETTGPLLHKTDAVLGIQCFIPEVWLGQRSEADRINWKRDFAQRWFKTGIPFIMDVSPGYDNHLVFPKTALKYGYTPEWQKALTKMVNDFGRNGIVFNSWNGYTEGMAAVPTREHKDVYYRWLHELNTIVPVGK